MPAFGHQRTDTDTTRQEPADGGSLDGAAGADTAARADVAGAAEPAEQVADFGARRAKIERLRAEGVDPYPHVRLPDRTKVAGVLAAHDPSQLTAGEHEDMPYHVAGRLVSRRGHGKTSFLDLRDLSGSIQVV